MRRVDALGGTFVLAMSMQFGAVVVMGKSVTTSGFPVPAFLALRFGLAGVLLAGVVGVRRKTLRAAPEEGWRLAALGMAGYATESTLFFQALQHGTAAAVTLLFFTYPVIVALIAVARGQGLPGWLLGGAMAVSLAGAALVVVAGAGVDIATAGVLFALASATTFALYLTGADAVLKETDSLTGAMWVSGSAGVALAVFAVLTGHADLPHGGSQWAAVVASALFTAGAFVCLFAGLRRLGPVRTSVIAATEPLAASALAVVFLSEPLRASTILGGALILCGAVAASVARPEPEREPRVP